MKQKLSLRVMSRCLCVAAALSSATIVSADTTSNSFVTFQVDMSAQVGSTFTPGTDTVWVHGTYNGWASGNGFQLTNNSGAANPNLYSGTLNNTQETNGAVTIFKYTIDNTNYETCADGQNRVANLPTNSGGSLVLPTVFYSDAGPAAEGQVTFQLDMSEQVNIGAFNPGAGDYVDVAGSFNGWSSSGSMNQNTTGDTNIWTLTIPVDGSTNSAQEFKFRIITAANSVNWESLPNTSPNVDYNSGNRFLSEFTHTLPLFFFNEIPYSSLPPVTNNVTFVLDMSVQQELGTFTNSNPDSSVEIHGDFNSWGAGVTLTNNPGSADPLLYSTTIQYVGAPAALYNYKFVLQPGTQWENVPGGGNRTFIAPRANGDLTLGPLFFGFQGPGALDDVVPITNSTVTFTVDMKSAVGTDGVTFDPSSDTVWVNGINNGVDNSYWTWSGLGGPAQFQLTNIPSTTLYSTTLPVNLGQSIDVTYKYGINGADDEAASGDNHTRYIRGFPNYQFPTDVFGSQSSGTSGEPSFGNLAVSPQAGGVSLTWLGREHVHLESTPSLTAPVWTPIYATDGTNLSVTLSGVTTGTASSNYWTYTARTNYPAASGALFYRLVYP